MKEQQRKLNKKETNEEEEEQDESPKMDQPGLQITETKTRSEKAEVRKEQDKKDITEGRNKSFKLDNKTPPGPGEYTIPSSVNCINLYSLTIRIKG